MGLWYTGDDFGRDAMKVYLVQHGEAKPEAEDPERPLTEKGTAVVESIAHYLAPLGVEVAQVLHSGRLRARQTAEVFARHLSAKEIGEEKGLGPSDDPREAKGLIDSAPAPLMICGHLPHLSRLASLLTLGSAEKDVIRFKTGGVVCLGRSDGRWAIEWALVPELVRHYM
jgi:phosphohistidine phosphatase